MTYIAQYHWSIYERDIMTKRIEKFCFCNHDLILIWKYWEREQTPVVLDAVSKLEMIRPGGIE